MVDGLAGDVQKVNCVVQIVKHSPVDNRRIAHLAVPEEAAAEGGGHAWPGEAPASDSGLT